VQRMDFPRRGGRIHQTMRARLCNGPSALDWLIANEMRAEGEVNRETHRSDHQAVQA
jgi:hypothetical protein